MLHRQNMSTKLPQLTSCLSLTHIHYLYIYSNSVTDISVTEAFKVDDFDPAAVKSALDSANETYAKATDPAEKAKVSASYISVFALWLCISIKYI